MSPPGRPSDHPPSMPIDRKMELHPQANGNCAHAVK